MTKLAIVVLTVSVFIEAGLLCGLFTNEWIREKEYYLGIRRYCFSTKNDTSCHNVEDILPDIKGNVCKSYETKSCGIQNNFINKSSYFFIIQNSSQIK